jgi:GDP-L-fucose synthase
MIQNNAMYSAHDVNTKWFCFLGASYIYPRDCTQPIKEKYSLSGLLEKTNMTYGIAKTTGIELCNAYNQLQEHVF